MNQIQDKPANLRVAMLDSQLRAFSAECKREGKSMTETINGWINYYLSESAKRRATK